MTTLRLLRAFALVSASRCDGPSRPILQTCANTVGPSASMCSLSRSSATARSSTTPISCRRLRMSETSHEKKGTVLPMQPGDERNLLLDSIPLVQAPSSVGERQKLLVRRHHTAPATRRGRTQPHRDYLPAGRRGLLQMLVRFACIDQHLGAVGPRLRREPAGIESGRPGVAQDVDVFRRMAACAQRPKAHR